MPRAASWTPTAQEITALVDKAGVGALAGRLGITRSQAEMLETTARRAMVEGRELGPLEVPRGTVATSAARQRLERVPAPSTPEQAAYVALFDRLTPPAETAEQTGARLDRERRQAVYQRNVKAGYQEWAPLLGEDDR